MNRAEKAEQRAIDKEHADPRATVFDTATLARKARANALIARHVEPSDKPWPPK